MKFSVRPRAAREGAEARAWYRESGESGGERFTHALEAALRLAREMPHAGSPDERGNRRILVHGFPYAVCYRVSETEIVVLAVAHTSRKPGYWERRR